jgi:hypothetical protein
MPQFRSRRSCRVALSVPIRVIGIDYRGIDFSEDTVTIVVNRHGAKIRMSHQLLPDQEIRVLSQATYQDAVFRVVSKLPVPAREYSYWGIESLDPRRNLWGLVLPELEPEDQFTVRVQLECPTCSARESVRLDETLLTALLDEGGVPRGCLTCKRSGMWRLLPFPQA